MGDVNQQALFPRVAAVMDDGAPQVVVPQLADQPWWGSRVADLGIGAAHDGPTPTVQSLSAALEMALRPKTRTRAAAVAGMIRADGAAVAAEWLLETVRSG